MMPIRPRLRILCSVMLIASCAQCVMLGQCLVAGFACCATTRTVGSISTAMYFSTGICSLRCVIYRHPHPSISDSTLTGALVAVGSCKLDGRFRDLPVGGAVFALLLGGETIAACSRAHMSTLPYKYDIYGFGSGHLPCQISGVFNLSHCE